MSFTVIVKEEAHQDVNEAYSYYEEKSPGLGEKFLEALYKRYNEIANQPTFYSYIEEDPHRILRDVKIDKFPFLIVYEIAGNDVIVYAIHNTFKHPRNKLRKT